jgi:hypothetical protein
MLKPRDNFGPDAVALPRRNIFAPPSTTQAPQAAVRHGVFDAAAACRDADLDDQARRAALVEAGGADGRGRLARLVAVGIAAGLPVVLILASLGARTADRATPAPAPAHKQPAKARVTNTRPKLAPRIRQRAARHRRQQRARRPPRHAAAVGRHVVPAPRSIAPSRAPVAPLPAMPHQRAMPRPSRVPADSPPEFL